MLVLGALASAMPVAASTVFTHVADSSNTFLFATQMDHPAINSDPDARIIIAQVYNPEGDVTGTLNPHFVGLRYDDMSGRWSIENPSLGLMPEGSAFRVLVVDATESFFVHEVTGSMPSHITTLDHPSVNDNADARIFLTRNSTPGGDTAPRTSNALKISWDGARWSLISFDAEGAEDFATGTAFNVYVPPSSSATAVHVTSTGNLSAGALFSRIDLPLSNGNPDAYLFLTHLAPDVGHTSTSHPFGAVYDAFFTTGRWAVFHEDEMAMSTETYFHVLAVPGPLFADGFESGSTSAWSSSAP